MLSVEIIFSQSREVVFWYWDSHVKKEQVIDVGTHMWRVSWHRPTSVFECEVECLICKVEIKTYQLKLLVQVRFNRSLWTPNAPNELASKLYFIYLECSQIIAQVMGRPQHFQYWEFSSNAQVSVYWVLTLYGHTKGSNSVRLGLACRVGDCQGNMWVDIVSYFQV